MDIVNHTFAVDRGDLSRTTVLTTTEALPRPRRGGAAGRHLRADREQHHLRRPRRPARLLALLPRRSALGRDPGLGVRRRGRVGLRRHRTRRTALRLLAHGHARAAHAGAGDRRQPRRRHRTPAGIARGLQPVPAHGGRPGLARGPGGHPGAAAPRLHHVVPDRRPARRRRAAARAGGADQRVEQDGPRPRVAAAAARRGRGRAHVAGQPRLRRGPGVFRHGAALRPAGRPAARTVHRDGRLRRQQRAAPARAGPPRRPVGLAPRRGLHAPRRHARGRPAPPFFSAPDRLRQRGRDWGRDETRAARGRTLGRLRAVGGASASRCRPAAAWRMWRRCTGNCWPVACPRTSGTSCRRRSQRGRYGSA